jgi:hypothetical protein
MIPASFFISVFFNRATKRCTEALEVALWLKDARSFIKKPDLSCHQKEFTNQIQTALWWESPGTD